MTRSLSPGHLSRRRDPLRRALSLLLLLWLLLAWMAPAGPTQAAAPLGDPVTRTGLLTVSWGDSRSGSSTVVFALNTEGENPTQVLIDDALARRHGGLVALNHRRVTVRGRWVNVDGAQSAAIRAEAVEPVAGDSPGPSSEQTTAVSGSHPWINLLCKFADISSEPRSLAYFDGLIGETEPGLGHYWREASYDSLNIQGSGSSGWYTLPEPRSYYLGFSSSDMLNELFADCTAVADSTVDFSNFDGINLMFNEELDGFAWGGSQRATLDGETRSWHATWEPPWAYGNQAVTAHEMGHGFGLPHSSGPYGLTYDNEWDLMSDTWSNCARASDPTYGCLGQHTIAYHKESLGWIPDGLRYQAVDGDQTLTLEQLALPETDSYRIAVIPIGGSSDNFYTLEVRNWAGYDVKLPGEAVIIHEVDTTRSRPAQVVDPDGDGDTGDDGAMWTVGESFSDGAHQISVAVNSASASGYSVTITLGDVPPPTETPTATQAPTETPVPSSTPTPSPTDTPEPTDTPLPTSTPTPVPTDTPEPTDTPLPPTATDTPEPTATPTPVPTDTPEPTNTPLPPTATDTPEPTDTPLPTSTPTAVPSDTPEPTNTPTSTATDTPLPPTETPTATQAPTETYTPQPTSTHTPQPTATCTAPSSRESRGKSKGRFAESPPYEFEPGSPCFEPPGQRPPLPWLLERLPDELEWLQELFTRIMGR